MGSGRRIRSHLTGSVTLRQTRRLIGKRQQRLALCAGEAPARVLAKKKQYEGEYQTKADRESKWDDGHGC
jgi:hypothetical protein